MKIFFSHDFAVPLFEGNIGQRFGGAEMQIFAISNALAKFSDVDVSFIIKDESIKIPKVRDVNFSYFPKLISKGLPGISRISNRKRILSSLGDCSDGVFFHTVADLTIFQNFVYAKTLGLKFVLRLSCDADISGEFFPKDKQQGYLKILNNSDLIIAQSAEQSQALYESSGKKSVVIRNGFPDEQGLDWDNSREAILWVGRSSSLKRPWDFLEIARRIPDEQFLMILGKDDIQLAEWIKDSAASIDNLEIFEALPNKRVQALMQKAKLLVGTSAIEGFPNVYCEAMRAATPIASLSIDPDGIIANNNLGIVSENNMEKFVADIARLLNNDAMMREFSVNARAYFKQNFLIDIIGQQYYDVLSQVL